MSRLRCLAALAVPFTFATLAAAQQPWDRGPFSAKPGELAAAARSVEGPRPDPVILLDETRVVLDAASKGTTTRRVVYRLGSSIPEDLSVVAAMWQPWLQQRPTVRARVIRTDGTEARLDPKTLSESPLRSIGIQTFGDARILQGPLPALGPGAVVEVEISLKDVQSIFEQGVTLSFPFGSANRVLRTVLSIDVPASLPLRHAAVELPDVKAARTEPGKRVVWTFENGPMAALDPLLVSVRPDKQPRIAFSTAHSWKEIAEGYSKIVDSRLSLPAMAAVAKDAIAGAAAREEIIGRLLTRVQRIRYAAVQLGEASIVPTAPADTVRLEYGDCKDQAALLISLLRSAGIEAHMALLNAGAGPDILPELPGFGGFNHAIVYVPGDTPLWIDPTAQFSRAGQLPTSDQGRLALVAKPDTTDLVRTPEMSSRIVIRQEVRLAEQGSGTVVRSSEYFGAQELEVRAAQSGVDEAGLAESLADAAAVLYGAGEVRDVHKTDSKDFSSPFRVSFEAVDAALAQTSAGEAAYFFYAAGLVAESGIVPVSLIEEKYASEGFQLDESYSNEWHVRIVPPAGYRKRGVPEDRVVHLGPATLSLKFEPADDGAVLGTMRFDTGRRFYSARDVADLKSALESLSDESPIQVSFEQIAQAYLEEGDYKSALAEYRRLIATHPAEGWHRMELAWALLRTGMGEDARREAKIAAEQEPDSAKLQAGLGWVLEHDLVGRRWKRGADLAAAKTAYEKALELDPENVTTRSEYALLLEFDLEGNRYGPNADLSAAVGEFRKIQDKLPKDSPMRRNLPYDLFRLGQYDELRSASTPADIRIAAIAALDGSAAAVREASRLEASTRQTTLTSASSLLSQARLYEAAAAMLRASGTGSAALSLSSRADQLSRMQRFEDLDLPGTDPSAVAKRFLALALLHADAQTLEPLLTAAGREVLRRDPGMRLPVAQMPVATPAGIGTSSPLAVVDAALADVQAASDGDDATGYRIELRGGYLGGRKFLFVILEDGQYRVLSPAATAFDLARLALKHLDSGDLIAARDWIRWAEDEISLRSTGADRLALEAFLVIWSSNFRSEAERIRYAANSILAASGESAAEARSVLTEARKTAAGRTKAAFGLAIGAALLTEMRFDESLALARELMKENPRAEPVLLLAQSLLEMNRASELLPILRDKAEEFAEPEVTRLLAGVESLQGEWAAAEARMRKLASSPLGEANDEVLASWFALYRDTISDEALQKALRAALPRIWDLDAGPIRLASALLAAGGKPEEALAMLGQAIDMFRAGEPQGDDWYVLGRIYEQAGENAAAARAFRLVREQRAFPPGVISIYHLAQEGLARVLAEDEARGSRARASQEPQ